MRPQAELGDEGCRGTARLRQSMRAGISVRRDQFPLLERLLPDVSDRRCLRGIELETNAGRGEGQRQDQGRHAGLLQSDLPPAIV